MPCDIQNYSKFSEAEVLQATSSEMTIKLEIINQF